MIETIICAPLYSRSTGYIARGAIAVAQGRILAAGSQVEIRMLGTASTRIINHDDDSLMIPAFCDSHQHFLSYIRGRVERLSLWDATSLEQVFHRIAQRAASLPKGTWIIADGHDQGRYHEQRHPLREELDHISPAHPVLIHRACHHIAIANSLALEIASITSTTPHPVGGRIGKRADGELNGILEESARTLVTSKITLPSIDWQYHIPAAVHEYHKRGITSIGEAAIGHINGVSDLEQMQTASHAGRLPLRVSYMGYGAVADAWLRGEHQVMTTDWHNAPIIKFFVDGTLGGESAWLSHPYRYNSLNSGYSLYTNETLCHVITRAHRAGYQIAVHAIGDLAVSQVLDAYEYALNSQPRTNHRHRIEHVEVLRDGLAPRFAALGVVAAVQPLFTWFEESDVAQLPDALLPYAHAWKHLADHGVPLAFGSDNPVVPDFTPVKGIAAAVQRHNYKGQIINPSQAVTWQQAVDAYTSVGAWSLQRESIFGDFQPGLAADIVILDKHFSTSEINTINVLQTWLDGQCVYSA